LAGRNIQAMPNTASTATAAKMIAKSIMPKSDNIEMNGKLIIDFRKIKITPFYDKQ
jgi:hypothetical protein